MVYNSYSLKTLHLRVEDAGIEKNGQFFTLFFKIKVRKYQRVREYSASSLPFFFERGKRIR